MRIIGGKVYTEDYRFREGEIEIRDGVITDVRYGKEIRTETVGTEGPGTENRFLSQQIATENRSLSQLPEPQQSEPHLSLLDASGCYVIPGLIDLHFHGCMGEDFCDGTMKAVETLAEYEAKEGITAICPATLTLPVEELKEVLACGAAYAKRGRDPHRADLIGINMEGPFISHVKKGAQNGKYILPASAQICRDFVQASEGLLKIIGLAPEENPGFEEYIREVKGLVKVSLAHTNADYDTAMRAFDAGADHAVHLYNAMPEMTHRAPGVPGAVQDSPHVMAEIICDGNHVHPSVVRAAFSMIGEERMILISDSLRATGLGDGRILLGGQEVDVTGTKAVLVQGGNLAGSVTNLMDCMRIAVQQMHIPLESAVRCATANPAKALRLAGSDPVLYGRLLPGMRGNAVLLREEDLSVKAVVKDGVVIRQES